MSNSLASLAVGKLTPEFIAMFCNIISHGNYPETACKALRISESTFRSWMRLGKKSESGIHREFYERVLQADSAAEAYAVEVWRSNFGKDTRAAPNFLSRRYPGRWGERKFIKIEVEKEIEQMMRVLQQRLPEDIFVMVLNEIALINSEQNQEVLE